LDFEWKPRDFSTVVQKVTSAKGDMLASMMQRLSKTGYLTCPPPPWDPDGVYRVGASGTRLEVQRLDDGSKWQPCAVRPQVGKAREKQQKFGILDSPTLLTRDLESAVGPMGASLLYLDVDNFKAVNTLLTERVVDRSVLPELQRSIEVAARGHGFAYAEGGDEMIVLLPNVTPLVGFAFAESLREHVSKQLFLAEGKSVHITLSIGLAVAMNQVPPTALPERANLAKAHAKKNGKNAVAVYDAEGIRLLSLRFDAISRPTQGPFIRPR
jgi:diguanylate cyclase (GGDEF)-like protein